MTRTKKTAYKISKTAKHAPFWKKVYQDAFGEGIKIQYMDGYGKVGISLAITLPNKENIFVWQKFRLGDFTDVLLEYEMEQGKLGWIRKPLKCAYIAYAIPSQGICYLLKKDDLQAAWIRKESDWKFYELISNRGTTRAINYSVPIEEIKKEMTVYEYHFKPLSQEKLQALIQYASKE